MTQFGWTLDRPDPILVDTDEKVQALRKKMMNCDLLAIDTETTGLDIMRDTVVYWSISTGDDRYFLFRNQLPLFEDIFSDPGYAWIGSQMKYDAHMMANSGYPLAGDLLCTLTMDRLVYPGRRHGLKECYMREFNERMATFAQTFDVIKKKGNFQLKKGTALFQAFQEKYGVVPKELPLHEILLEKYKLDPEPVIDYASLDAWTVFRLFNKLKSYLEETETARGYTLWEVFLWCEVPFTRVLFNMERRGVSINQKYLGDMIPRIEKELEEIEKKLNKAAGYPVNVNSPTQLVKLFYSPPPEGLGLKPVKMTSGGKSGAKKPSLDKEAMAKHVEDGVEEARIIVQYRKMSKLLSSFVKNLLKFCDDNGRVHATQQQHVVETGRLSVTNPPLQTLPRPTKDFDIRTSVVAPPGYRLIVADYDQVEMFALAHFSGDEGMIKNIHAGRDIHTSNVELVWGEPYDEVAAAKKHKGELTERQEYLLECRQDIKTVGFGQPNLGRSKTHSKRGNPTGAIPCCVARRSVSTCGVSA